MAAPKKVKLKAKSKPKPKRTNALARSTRPVEIKVDAALKRAWETAKHALSVARHEGASSFDTLWETIGEVIDHEPPLYLAGGYATVKAFLADFVEENERTARRLVRVAKYASPNEEAKYGVSKLDEAIAFVEAKVGAPAKGRIPVDFAKLRIPVKRDGRSSTVVLDDATVEEVRAATRGLARGSSKPPKAKSSPVVMAITGVLKAPHLRDVRVSLAHGTITLSGISLEAFADVAKALTRVKLPAADAKGITKKPAK